MTWPRVGEFEVAAGVSLIHTAELNGVAPFDYLVALLRHADQVRANPQEWMPWNYVSTLAHSAASTGPPG